MPYIIRVKKIRLFEFRFYLISDRNQTAIQCELIQNRLGTTSDTMIPYRPKRHYMLQEDQTSCTKEHLLLRCGYTRKCTHRDGHSRPYNIFRIVYRDRVRSECNNDIYENSRYSEIDIRSHMRNSIELAVAFPATILLLQKRQRFITTSH